MTLVHDTESSPAAHALVIACGRYPHLQGGSGKLAKNALGLGQLSPPRHSAILLTRWLLETYSNPDLPLGSIDLLISPEGPYDLGLPAPMEVEAARRDNVDAAFDRWYQRCNAHPQNAAVFYFCGHGVQREFLTLLLEDYGKGDNRPFAGAFDYNTTRDSLAQCVASRQLFFVDACREVNSTLLGTVKIDAAPLRYAEFERPHLQTIHEYHSAAIAYQAFGPKLGSPTYFTEALVRALNGTGAASRGRARWVITPDSLAMGIRHVMRDLQQQAGAPIQNPTHTSAPVEELEIHHFTDPPTAKLQVAWRPPDAAASGHLVLQHRWYGDRQYIRLPAPGVWEQEVVAGVYDVTPTFEPPAYRPAVVTDAADVQPPVTTWVVEAANV